MRIANGGPPKTGNTWLRYLLASIYDLVMVKVHPLADRGFRDLIATGGFPDGAICTRHVNPTTESITWGET
jgi:hypothetical protein